MTTDNTESAMDELQRLGQEWEALPKRCDGIEQPAFEEWARAQGYDMTEHPLHYLFLDAKTDAARQGRAAGLKHASDRIAATLSPDDKLRSE